MEREHERTDPGGNGALLQLVSFNVGEEEFGLDILRVQEIIRTQQLTRVPNLPDYRIVVVDVHGQILGFVVDAVSEVLRISTDTVEPTPRLGKVERDYISGVGKLDSRLLLLLDLERLMTDDEVAVADKPAPIN